MEQKLSWGDVGTFSANSFYERVNIGSTWQDEDSTYQVSSCFRNDPVLATDSGLWIACGVRIK